jgi:hypothetical protein
MALVITPSICTTVNSTHMPTIRSEIVRTIPSIGVRIISSVGIRLISAVIPSIGIWISIVSTSIGSTINPTNVPTVGSIIVLCIIWLSLSGLHQVTQPC